MRVASKQLSKELFDLTGWDDCDFSDYYGTLEWHLPGGVIKDPNDSPRYDLDYLVAKAIETGHIHVKIKHGEKGIIVTAPPCYHIEAQTPADGVAKLLIRSAKKGIIT